MPTTVPLSGTNIRLLTGVPFANDYKHTRWFDTQAQQTNYFLNRTLVHSIAEAPFQRIEGQNFVNINLSIDALWNVNYLMFQNFQYNDAWFYAFVTKIEYVQKNTTRVHFEIDVFQTWKFDMDFKPSYVVREHCPLWNPDGTPVINTVDEGLNYGTDYDIVYANEFSPNLDIFYLVIVAKSSLHVPDGVSGTNWIMSTLNGSPQPLCYYVHPFSLDGSSYNVIINGVATGLDDVTNVMLSMYTNEDAVNNIVSMFVTQHIGVNADYDFATNSIVVDSSFAAVNVSPNGTSNTLFVQNLPSYETSIIDCGPKYSGYSAVDESKLLMYPYALTVLDDFKGNRVVLKNEYIGNTNLNVSVMGSIGTSNKVAYIPRDYLTQNLVDFNERTRIAIENGLIDTSAHDVPIITDMLSAYLQGNRNSLQNQAHSIIFNGMTDMVGGMIGGVAAGMTGNAAGVAASGVGVVKGGGNAALQLQGLQAKIKDINNTPPQLAKMGSNTAFDYGNGYKGFYVIKKQIKPEYRKKLSDYFKTYGYKVNEVKMPNFHTRQSWNYVQTLSCNIVGNFNNEDLQALKNVFDNGITLWHTDDVCNYSLPNGVIA